MIMIIGQIMSNKPARKLTRRVQLRAPPRLLRVIFIVGFLLPFGVSIHIALWHHDNCSHCITTYRELRSYNLQLASKLFRRYVCTKCWCDLPYSMLHQWHHDLQNLTDSPECPCAWVTSGATTWMAPRPFPRPLSLVLVFGCGFLASKKPGNPLRRRKSFEIIYCKRGGRPQFVFHSLTSFWSLVSFPMPHLALSLLSLQF